MRLIDAEHLKWNVGGIKCGTLTVAYLDWILEHEEPTVEAIPIEWIKKYTEENRLYQSDDFDLYISDMIADWAEREEK